MDVSMLDRAQRDPQFWKAIKEIADNPTDLSVMRKCVARHATCGACNVWRMRLRLGTLMPLPAACMQHPVRLGALMPLPAACMQHPVRLGSA
eukprot:364215-Chlamydomonas_euryale.AAC.13